MATLAERAPWLPALGDAERIHQIALAWVGVSFIFAVLFCWGLWYGVSSPDELPAPDPVRRRIVMAIADVGAVAIMVGLYYPDLWLISPLDVMVVGLLGLYHYDQRQKRRQRARMYA